MYRYVKDVLPFVKIMLTDEKCLQARKTGAKLACLAALKCTDASSLRDICIRGDLSTHKGAAKIYSAKYYRPPFRGGERLDLFLNDESTEVRSEASNFIRELNAIALKEIPEFIRTWSQSKALDEGADSAAYILEQFSVANPELTLDLSERLIEVLGNEITNMG